MEAGLPSPAELPAEPAMVHEPVKRESLTSFAKRCDLKARPVAS
jgi:hypothetical protein